MPATGSDEIKHGHSRLDAVGNGLASLVGRVVPIHETANRPCSASDHLSIECLAFGWSSDGDDINASVESLGSYTDVAEYLSSPCTESLDDLPPRLRISVICDELSSHARMSLAYFTRQFRVSLGYAEYNRRPALCLLNRRADDLVNGRLLSHQSLGLQRSHHHRSQVLLIEVASRRSHLREVQPLNNNEPLFNIDEPPFVDPLADVHLISDRLIDVAECRFIRTLRRRCDSDVTELRVFVEVF